MTKLRAIAYKTAFNKNNNHEERDQMNKTFNYKLQLD